MGQESILKEQGKKACYLLREDGPVIEVGENDTLIINKLVGEPSYFGIFGFSYYDNSKDKVQAHLIENTKISLKSIQDGSYPISRPLFFYVKNQHIGVIPGVEEYVKEFTSKRAAGKRGYLLDLGSAGFIAVLFGFMIYNLIQSQKEQSEDLEEIKQSIHKMESVLDSAMQINVKLIDRHNRGDEKREEFWREISDDLSFIKAKLTNGHGRH
jgi:hypothetical protein